MISFVPYIRVFRLWTHRPQADEGLARPIPVGRLPRQIGDGRRPGPARHRRERQRRLGSPTRYTCEDFAWRKGSTMVNTVPSPGTLATLMVPSCASMS
jgi:hypothetical protein